MAEENLDTMIDKLIEEGLQKSRPRHRGPYANSDLEKMLVQEIFTSITGALPSDEMLDSPLGSYLHYKVTPFISLRNNISDLYNELKEDIIEQYMNSSHWDKQMIKDYIANHTEVSRDNTPQDMIEMVEDLLNEYSPFA